VNTVKRPARSRLPLEITRELWKKKVEDQRLIALEAFSEMFD